MADDQRLYRTNDAPRGGQAAAQPSKSGSDPLTELARLIGQGDPFGEFGRDGARRPAAPLQAGQPQAPAFAEPAQEYDREGYDDAAEDRAAGVAAGPAGDAHEPYFPGEAPYAEDEHDLYEEAPPPRRRVGIMVIAGVFALAVMGTAGAFGYRTLFGPSGFSGPPPVIKADTTPSKIVPAGAGKDASTKLITDRVNDRAQDEKIVPRAEKPVEVADRSAPLAVASNPPTASLGNGVVASEPKKIHTIAIRPDGAALAAAGPVASAPPANVPFADPPLRETAPRPVATQPIVEREAPRQAAAAPAPLPPVKHTASAATPGNAPLSLSPSAARAAAPAPVRTASVAPTQVAAPAATATRAGGYAVQISSQRSEAEAQAAFRGMQGKYPTQLGGRQLLIHKVDLGAKGTYYRALVGPFAEAGQASQLCSSLKAAGGQCIVQRN